MKKELLMKSRSVGEERRRGVSVAMELQRFMLFIMGVSKNREGKHFSKGVNV